MNKALLCALLVVILGAVVGGLSVVGGPGYARMEKNDRERAQLLREYGRHHACQLTQANREEGGTAPSRCVAQVGADDPKDPVTGHAFLFEKTSDMQFRVCAQFETGEVARPAYAFEQIEMDGQTGCIYYVQSDPSKEWRIR